MASDKRNTKISRTKLGGTLTKSDGPDKDISPFCSLTFNSEVNGKTELGKSGGKVNGIWNSIGLELGEFAQCYFKTFARCFQAIQANRY